MKYLTFLILSFSVCSGLCAQGFERFGSFSSTSGRMIVANMDTIGNPDIIHRTGGGIFGGPISLRLVLNPGLTEDATIVSNIAAPEDIGSGLAAGDLDGDGDNDLVASKTGEDFLYLFENQGAGVFHTSLLTIDGVGQLIMADMNGDSILDIIGTSSSADQLTVWANDGAGSCLKTQVSTFNAFSFVAMTVGDIDADGDQDIVICYDGFADNNLVLYLNEGDLTFTASNPRPRSVRNILQVSMADINNDDKLDILVADRSEIFAVPQTEDGFGPAQTLFTSSRNFNSFAFGDYDENGLTDIVIGYDSDVRDGIVLQANYGVETTYDFDSIFIGGNRPTFNMIAADMDLDGDVDLVSTNNSTYYFRNDLEKVPVSVHYSPGSAKTVRIFPNPAGREIYLDVEDDFRGDVSVRTIDGREILRRRNVSAQDPLSVASLRPGPFVVLLRNERTGEVYRSIGHKF